jgi:hypothetical protein
MSYPAQWGQNIDPSFSSQNPLNYSLFPGQDGTIGSQVEHLELIKTQCIVAVSALIQATDSLLQENTELKAENQRLKAGEGCLPYAHFIFLAF